MTKPTKSEDWPPKPEAEFVEYPEDVAAFAGHLMSVGKYGDNIIDAAEKRAKEAFRRGVTSASATRAILERFKLDDEGRKLIARLVASTWSRTAMLYPTTWASESVLSPEVRATRKPVGPIEPTLHVPVDPTTIPPRPWIMRPSYMRGKVTLTSAQGGVGKSTLVMVECVAMATGQPLLGHPMQSDKPLNVWYWNGEDDEIELTRKFAAIESYYGLKASDFTGKLYKDYGGTLPIKLAVLEDGVAKIVDPEVDRLIQAMLDFKIDVLAVDPFVTTHGLSENQADQMEIVTRKWTRIGDATKAAIGIVHHNRKTGGNAGTIEDTRGSTAIVAAARIRRAVNQMTEAQAKDAAIPVEQRRSYISVDDAMTNVKPPSSGLDWFKLESVNLGNDPAAFDGDDLGVATPFKYAKVAFVPTDPIEDDMIVAALRKKAKWREDAQSEDWIGVPIGKALGHATLKPANAFKAERKRVNGIITNWIKEGRLVRCEGEDARGRNRPCLSINPPTT